MLKKIPLWGWVAGGAVLLVGALMLTGKRAPSSGNSETSPFTDLLQQLMTSLSNLQGSIQNPGNTLGGGAGGATGGIGATGPAGATGAAGSSPTTPPKTVSPVTTTAIAPTGHTSTASATAAPVIAASRSSIPSTRTPSSSGTPVGSRVGGVQATSYGFEAPKPAFVAPTATQLKATNSPPSSYLSPAYLQAYNAGVGKKITAASAPKPAAVKPNSGISTASTVKKPTIAQHYRATI